MYSSADFLPKRFFNLAKFLLLPEVNDTYEHQPNKGEKLANVMLHPIENFPQYLTNPKVVTLGLSALALLVDSYLFYPQKTQEFVERVFNFLKEHQETLRLTAYLFSVNNILGYTLRAESRLFDQVLMEKVYSN